MGAEILHGFASCMLNPAIAAITLSLVAARMTQGGEPGELGRRLGRNASFGSIGNALAAGLMGGVGYAVSARATFFLGAALALPGLLALRAIERPKLRIPDAAAAADPDDAGTQVTASHSVLSLLRDRRLFAFAVCAALFHLSNAGMLPLAAGRVTREAPQQAELIIAACILLPQLVVAVLSPQVGRLAETLGRRPVMLVGFAALPIRGLLLATSSDPWLTVLFQMFDGVKRCLLRGDAAADHRRPDPGHRDASTCAWASSAWRWAPGLPSAPRWPVSQPTGRRSWRS